MHWLRHKLCGSLVGHRWKVIGFASLAWGSDMKVRKFRRCLRCGKMEPME